MKKLLLAFILVFALFLCGCDDGTATDNSENTSGKAVVMSEAQSFKLDAVNYNIENIENVKKLADEGVLYAYCSSAESVNQTISVLNQLPESDLKEYGTDNKNLVLTLITLGEGEKSSYSIEKIELETGAALNIYVKTNAGDPTVGKIGEYHFVRLDVPVCGEINVYLDGVQVGK